MQPDQSKLDAFVAKATQGLPPGSTVQALMEPTGMSWFPVAHRLAEAGVEDFDRYAVKPGETLAPDLFLD